MVLWTVTNSAKVNSTLELVAPLQRTDDAVQNQSDLAPHFQDFNPVFCLLTYTLKQNHEMKIDPKCPQLYFRSNFVQIHRLIRELFWSKVYEAEVLRAIFVPALNLKGYFHA